MTIPFPHRPRLRGVFTAMVYLSLTAFWGCQSKDTARSGERFTPPWESDQETLLRLPGHEASPSDSAFGVFAEMAAIDSAAGPRRLWTYEMGSLDTLRVGHLVDTQFVFPEQPMALQAYAYDETYRDDTLFRAAYGNGLYVENHPCAEVWVFTAPFMHPVQWLRSGMSRDEIEKSMGTPSLRHQQAIRYLYRDEPDSDARPSGSDLPAPLKVEGIHFYFHHDSLFAAVFQRSRPCH